jgi:hypothetical protein
LTGETRPDFEDMVENGAFGYVSLTTNGRIAYVNKTLLEWPNPLAACLDANSGREAGNKQHRDETGVNAPTRNAMRRIRRNARKKGISETEAYFQWLNRKQARRPTGSNFAYSADTRPPNLITTPTPEEAARDAADEPLKALALHEV